MKSEQIKTEYFFKDYLGVILRLRLWHTSFSFTYQVQHLIFASFITTKNALDIDDPWSFPSSVQHTYLVPRSPTVRIRQSEI